MKLYIETENGQCKNHPAFGQNLLEVFGFIPNQWEEFVRIEKPELGAYQVFESEEPVYQKVDGVWTDVWALRDMTDEEKAVKQQNTISMFRNRDQAENWSAWTLDEATCTMIPPILRPEPDQAKLDVGIFTVWCGAENNWKDTPERPSDGIRYKFDYFAWQWVQVVN